jgi:hypothetical protein
MRIRVPGILVEGIGSQRFPGGRRVDAQSQIRALVGVVGASPTTESGCRGTIQLLKSGGQYESHGITLKGYRYGRTGVLVASRLARSHRRQGIQNREDGIDVGSVGFLTDDRIKPLDTSFAGIAGCMKTLGRGSSEILSAATKTFRSGQS